MPSTRKSPRKNLGMRPNFYGTDGDQDHMEITRGKVRAKQPSKKKPPRGYKKPRKQLQAPARKISSEPLSESSEYDEESESDDDKKGLLIDISRKDGRWQRLVRTGGDESGKPTMMTISMTITPRKVVQD